jgi:hypothetical protein
LFLYFTERVTKETIRSIHDPAVGIQLEPSQLGLTLLLFNKIEFTVLGAKLLPGYQGLHSPEEVL